MPSRSVLTEIWGEEKFDDLTVLAKAVYLRLITGDDVGTAGATRTRTKRLASDLEGHGETLDPLVIEDALGELQAVGLVRLYDDGWLWLPTFVRRQARSRQYLAGALRQAAAAPDSLRVAITRAVYERATELGWDPDKLRTGNPAASRVESGSSASSKPAAPPAAGAALGLKTTREGQGQGSSFTRTRTPDRIFENEDAAESAPDGSTSAGPSSPGWSERNGTEPVLASCADCGRVHRGPGTICDACLEASDNDEARRLPDGRFPKRPT